MPDPICRFCNTDMRESFADLGAAPPSNAFIAQAQAASPQNSYPLHAYVCSACRLVQLEAFEPPEAIFSDYPYFSSFSDSWLRHAEDFAAAAIDGLALGPASQVIEIASNDGYLLQYFARRGIPVLGIEPAVNVAAIARSRGIPTACEFFGRTAAARLVAEGHRPDLIVANNVLAHVPDLNDFVAGLKHLLAADGVLSIEVPHLLRLIEQQQFDTIYHEHFSYFSLLTAGRVLAHHGLEIFDVAERPTHGGSLRISAAHAGARPTAAAVAALWAREMAAGLDDPEIYAAFAPRLVTARAAIRAFFATARAAGKTVAGYGAPAKGNTLLNFCAITPDDLPFTVDRSPHKQGLLLPGSRIPIRHPDAIRAHRPDYLFVLPWNLRAEITEQMADIRDWRGRFVIPIPELEIC